MNSSQNTIINLSAVDLILASLFIFAVLLLLWWQQLGMVRKTLIATLRAVMQLLFVGYVLEYVFRIESWYFVLLIIAVMITVAAITAVSTTNAPFRLSYLIFSGSLVLTSMITLLFTSQVIINVKTWYEPQYIIPLTGIILGNSMTGATVGGERIINAVKVHRLEIETMLSMGASPGRAMKPYLQNAIKAGMIPIINSMMIAGIIQMPGIMTGQILSGTRPIIAVKYQMLIMFMLLFAVAGTTYLVISFMYRLFFTGSEQLKKYDFLSK